jgi:AAHS family 4-hydroxybenzoate transporter-like MFS transporter
MSLLDLYFLSNWLPTVLNDLGVGIRPQRSDRCCRSAEWPGRLRSASSIASFRALALVYFAAVFAVGAIGHPRALRLRHPGDLRRRLL